MNLFGWFKMKPEVSQLQLEQLNLLIRSRERDEMEALSQAEELARLRRKVEQQ